MEQVSYRMRQNEVVLLSVLLFYTLHKLLGGVRWVSYYMVPYHHEESAPSHGGTPLSHESTAAGGHYRWLDTQRAAQFLAFCFGRQTERRWLGY